MSFPSWSGSFSALVMSFMMSTEDAILFSASELPQYAIINVNVSKFRK